jgi:hypothetical protein
MATGEKRGGEGTTHRGLPRRLCLWELKITLLEPVDKAKKYNFLLFLSLSLSLSIWVCLSLCLSDPLCNVRGDCCKLLFPHVGGFLFPKSIFL